MDFSGTFQIIQSFLLQLVATG